MTLEQFKYRFVRTCDIEVLLEVRGKQASVINTTIKDSFELKKNQKVTFLQLSEYTGYTLSFLFEKSKVHRLI